MPLELMPPVEPMEAELTEQIPAGDGWQYEPKWDGFRCLAFRDDERIWLQSKSGQSLERYFPELVEALRGLTVRRFVLDGEIVIASGGRLRFDELLLRIHPAKSRVLKLSAEFPASLIVFDLLLDARGTSLMAKTLAERRRRLETFYRKYLARQVGIRLSPATTEIATARKWFKKVGGDLDGIVAKRTDLPYQSGNRAGMQKIKRIHTADCVVGGARFVAGTKTVASLLLGLYDKDGLLNHVGFTSSFSAADRIKITKVVTPYFGSSGFTGHAPGGPSRWSKPEKQKWQPVRPELVVEVQYDQVTGGRFRHGTRFLRWRPDKAPRQCLMKQIERRQARSLKLLEPVAS